MGSRWSGAAAVSLVLLGTGLVGAPGASAVLPGEDKLDYGWKYLGYTCQQSSDGLRIRYVVKARMIVNNRPQFGRWATEMTFKARLVPSGAGLNLPRDWSSRTVRSSTPVGTSRTSPSPRTGFPRRRSGGCRRNMSGIGQRR